MSRAELLALAERVEAATGADRDIDHAIYAAFNPDKPIPYDRRLLPWEHLYTASLDAAMSLVPSGEYWECGPLPDMSQYRGRVGMKAAYAATPALALTAATLRALAERMTDD